MKRKLLGFTKSIVALRSFATMLVFISAFTVGWSYNYLIWKKQSASTWTESSLGSSDEVTITLEANVSYEFYLKDGSSNLWKFSNKATVEITGGTGYTLVQNTNGYNGTITNAAAGNYKFKPAWNNGTPTLTVTFPVVAYTPVLDKADEISCFYEVGSKDYSYIYVWNEGTKYAGEFPGTKMTLVGTTAGGKKIYKWTYSGSEATLPANVIFSLGNSSGQTQNLEFKNHGYYIDGTWNREITAVAETKYTVNISANTGGTVNATELQVGSTPVAITATANSGYTFEKWTSSSTGIKIADAYSPSTTITATADGTVTANFTATSSDPIYYVVFPDANVGNTARADKTVKNIPENHTAFRLIPSRDRNAKTLDKDLVSINLKIDGDKGRQLRYDTNGRINFYIIDNNGNYFRNTTDVNGTNDYLHAFQTGQLGKTANNGVDCYDTRDGSMAANKPGYHYTIHKNDAADTKSLTFMFSKNNKKDKKYIINNDNGSEETKTYSMPSNSVDGFNEREIKSGNLIVGFLTSRGYGSTYYNAHIKNGVYLVGKMNGVNYTRDKNYPMKQILYPLGTTDEAKADSIVYSCTVKKGSANWDDFFLSFSTGDKVEDDNNLWNLLLRPSVQNQMDGQALEGGVTFFKNDNGTDNAQQALNPLLSEAQKNRYVSYTIYFNATYSTYRIEFHDGFYIAGAAVSESGSYEPEKRIAMSSAELNGVQHYIYTGEFKNGEQFAFFLTEDSYAVNYCEDDQYVTSTSETDAWNVQAPANGADYAFYNRVLYNANGDNDGKTLGTGKSGMIWGLPTGTYTIRFYNHKEAAGNNQLYTVDKEVKMVNVKSTYSDSSDPTKETTKNEGGWRTFSDDCALLLPNGVTAYYAANVGKGKVYFKEVPNGYIPAHCPVIISNPNLLDGDKKIAFPVRPDGYDVKLADGEENYLVDCYDKPGKVSPEVTKDGKNKYNYFFTNMYKFYGSKEMSGVPLGFWKTFVNADTKKNYTYLSIDTKLNPSRYDEYANTFTYDENATVVSTKAYCFRMVFDEDELGDNTTTGIEKVTDNADVEMKNAVWYNMQGVRISKPAAPGMYICNGKKIVVR